MNNIQKMKTAFAVSGAASILSAVLKCIAMFTEFEPESGFFKSVSPINTVSDIISYLALAFFVLMTFSFKKRELFPIINYDSTLFRFFSSTSGCLMLMYAYVKWNEYLTEKASLTDGNAKKTTFLMLITVFSVASAAALMIYAFGRNEKNNPKRSFLTVLPAGVLLLRAIEIQFDPNVKMNDPLKINFQIASVILMCAIVYTVKCEFHVSESSPQLRFLTLMSAPVFVASFAIPTVICYYAKVSTVFAYLVDALLYISLCGFVLSSYTPCKKAKPISDAGWSEYDDAVAMLNRKEDEEEAYSLPLVENTEESDDSVEEMPNEIPEKTEVKDNTEENKENEENNNEE